MSQTYTVTPSTRAGRKHRHQSTRGTRGAAAPGRPIGLTGGSSTPSEVNDSAAETNQLSDFPRTASELPDKLMNELAAELDTPAMKYMLTKLASQSELILGMASDLNEQRLVTSGLTSDLTSEKAKTLATLSSHRKEISCLNSKAIGAAEVQAYQKKEISTQKKEIAGLTTQNLQLTVKVTGLNTKHISMSAEITNLKTNETTMLLSLATFEADNARLTLEVVNLKGQNEIAVRRFKEIDLWAISQPESRGSPALARIQLRVILDFALARLALALKLTCTPEDAAHVFRKHLGIISKVFPKLPKGATLTHEQWVLFDCIRLNNAYIALDSEAELRDPGVTAIRNSPQAMRLISQFSPTIRQLGDEAAHELPENITLQTLIDIVDGTAASLVAVDQDGMRQLAAYIQSPRIQPVA